MADNLSELAFSLLNSELAKLRAIRREARRVESRKTKRITIGSKVELTGPKTLKIMLGGFWIGRSKVDGYTLVTCESPIGKLLIGKKLYDSIELPVGQSIVTDVL